MKKILLFSLLFAIYLLSSVAAIPIMEPSKWSSMEFTYFNIPFHEIFHPSSPFYDLYPLYWDIRLFVHKASHLVFFGTLSLLFLWNLKKGKGRYMYAWLWTTLYAVSDEIHQISTPHRTGTIQDVFIDSFSALLFLAGWYVFSTYTIPTFQKMHHILKERNASIQ